MNVEEVLHRLENEYPEIFYYQNNDPFYVLITTVLSQRTRDSVTNSSAKTLFNKYNSPNELVHTDEDEIESLIKNVGFYRVKTQRIKQISEMILDEYDGQVPDNLNDLLKLPGVGRKTANCVLTYAFSKKAIAVDTHVHRISNRLGLVETKTPEKTEKDLKKIVPENLWNKINELFVRFGQNTCRPVSPRCDVCVLNDTCPKLI
ncbi:DNA-(apurinic or apyrimidinic site) lyase [Methanohalobium evestigatum Z-7303]|uniref:Endonuclease III n=1 Tax=Methanohalobium evestigatum (strain ATCC BAA-1072 / DSM 3721 / NBRC 107634 / OCM 161 / Z-7303) TaxID=644295 RepID=D7EB21_METEZ|nr:endonuclease III [Methanohalobium evestigatum]ADI74538.1 DNA-(apurinic or apyrimidinic site) lyase [Methanohalobium evestigatum Z-7303]